MKEKLYQMFILGTDGGNINQALSCGLGGVIFFSRDINSKFQFQNLIKICKSYSKITPFLAIDQEGGRVERTENIHNGKKYLSAKYAYEKGVDFLRNQTQTMAEELSEYGINLNFSPCIDVNTNPNNPIIGERSYSSNPDDVILAEKIVSETYRQNKIIPCAKHFPGHGDANSDSHLTLPKIDLTLEEMENVHLKPFKACANKIEMIMVAHLYCTCFENSKIPTSLSKNAINYLKNNLNYKGIIISDDMVMKGVSDFSTTEAIIKGIKAGLNMFIFRNSSDDVIKAIEHVYELAQNDTELADQINSSYEKIIALKQKFIM